MMGKRILWITTQKLSKSLHFDLSSTQKDIIEFLIQNPNAGRVEIALQLGNITEDGAKYNLKVLQEKVYSNVLVQQKVVIGK